MARTVFFSFHYQRDIFRVQQVKNHYVTKGNYSSAGFFDGSLEEKAKKEGDTAVKNLIDRGLNGCSVLCVLIGNQTYTRRWVHYEIFKSIELGMGVLGIMIHQIKDPKAGEDMAGTNPFEVLGYVTRGGKMVPMIHYTQGWNDAPNLSAISAPFAPYLKGTEKPVLSGLFRTYDWIRDNGYNNFSTWVENAAKQAGR